MKQKILQLVTGLLLVLVTGVFWGTWFALSRTMHELPPEIFITIGKQIMKNVAVPMSIIMPLSLAGLLILLIASWKRKSAYFYCILTTLLLFILALIITVAIEVPIDNQIKDWTVANLPSGWAGIRDRWEFYHTARTFISLAGISFFIVAIMNRRTESAR
ncbi:MAG TPA: anthrone oxygenase family protein [Chryseolinea sp.]|nr:anthrone oxygenase family protein [Chryseolinea sp.]